MADDSPAEPQSHVTAPAGPRTHLPTRSTSGTEKGLRGARRPGTSAAQVEVASSAVGRRSLRHSDGGRMHGPPGPLTSLPMELARRNASLGIRVPDAAGGAAGAPSASARPPTLGSDGDQPGPLPLRGRSPRVIAGGVPSPLPHGGRLVCLECGKPVAASPAGNSASPAMLMDGSFVLLLQKQAAEEASTAWGAASRALGRATGGGRARGGRMPAMGPGSRVFHGAAGVASARLAASLLAPGGRSAASQAVLAASTSLHGPSSRRVGGNAPPPSALAALYLDTSPTANFDSSLADEDGDDIDWVMTESVRRHETEMHRILSQIRRAHAVAHGQERPQGPVCTACGALAEEYLAELRAAVEHRRSSFVDYLTNTSSEDAEVADTRTGDDVPEDSSVPLHTMKDVVDKLVRGERGSGEMDHAAVELPWTESELTSLLGELKSRGEQVKRRLRDSQCSLRALRQRMTQLGALERRAWLAATSRVGNATAMSRRRDQLLRDIAAVDARLANIVATDPLQDAFDIAPSVEVSVLRQSMVLVPLASGRSETAPSPTTAIVGCINGLRLGVLGSLSESDEVAELAGALGQVAQALVAVASRVGFVHAAVELVRVGGEASVRARPPVAWHEVTLPLTCSDETDEARHQLDAAVGAMLHYAHDLSGHMQFSGEPSSPKARLREASSDVVAGLSIVPHPIDPPSLRVGDSFSLRAPASTADGGLRAWGEWNAAARCLLEDVAALIVASRDHAPSRGAPV